MRYDVNRLNRKVQKRIQKTKTKTTISFEKFQAEQERLIVYVIRIGRYLQIILAKKRGYQTG